MRTLVATLAVALLFGAGSALADDKGSTSRAFAASGDCEAVRLGVKEGDLEEAINELEKDDAPMYCAYYLAEHYYQEAEREKAREWIERSRSKGASASSLQAKKPTCVITCQPSWPYTTEICPVNSSFSSIKKPAARNPNRSFSVRQEGHAVTVPLGPEAMEAPESQQLHNCRLDFFPGGQEPNKKPLRTHGTVT